MFAVEGVKDGLFAAGVEFVVFAQEFLILRRERLGTGCYSNSFLASPFL